MIIRKGIKTLIMIVLMFDILSLSSSASPHSTTTLNTTLIEKFYGFNNFDFDSDSDEYHQILMPIKCNTKNWRQGRNLSEQAQNFFQNYIFLSQTLFNDKKQIESIYPDSQRLTELINLKYQINMSGLMFELAKKQWFQLEQNCSGPGNKKRANQAYKVAHDKTKTINDAKQSILIVLEDILVESVKHGHKKYVEELLLAGISPNICDDSSASEPILSIAIRREFMDIAAIILEYQEKIKQLTIDH